MRPLTIAAVTVTALVTLTGIQSADARGGRNGGGGSVSVSGYRTSRGTYVAPHTRTAPDGIRENNLSYRGGAILRATPAFYGDLISDPVEDAPSAPAPALVAYPAPGEPIAARSFCGDGKIVSGFCVLN